MLNNYNLSQDFILTLFIFRLIDKGVIDKYNTDYQKKEFRNIFKVV